MRPGGVLGIVVGDLVLLAVGGQDADPCGPRRAFFGVRRLGAELAGPGRALGDDVPGQCLDTGADQFGGCPEVGVNATTKARTIGDERGFSTVQTLARELELLENSPGSFVEFENRQGQVWQVEWHGHWSVTGASTRQIDTVQGILDFAYDALA